MTTEAKQTDGWAWWAGADEEAMTVGPCATREDAVDEATSDQLGEFKSEAGDWLLCFHVVEARKDGLRLADWIDADTLLERACENVSDSDRAGENDDGEYFNVSEAQEKDLIERVKRACDEWQAAHSLVFTTWAFSATRNQEQVTVPAGD